MKSTLAEQEHMAKIHAILDGEKVATPPPPEDISVPPAEDPRDDQREFVPAPRKPHGNAEKIVSFAERSLPPGDKN